MNTRRSLALLPLIIALVGSILSAPATAYAEDPPPTPPERQAQYTVVDLGLSLQGTVVATGINEKGVVVGNVTNEGHRRPWVYAGTSPTLLPMSGAIHAAAYDIGDNGTIGGWANFGDGEGPWAVVWKRAKDGTYPGITKLDKVAGVREGTVDRGGVLSVNARGDALVQYAPGGNAVYQTATGGKVVLERPTGYRDGIEIHDLNDRGEVSGGRYLDGSGESVGATWSAGGALRPLPATGVNYVGEVPAINNLGHVVAPTHAGVGYYRDGQWEIIPTLHYEGYDRFLRAEDLNDAGTAVGDFYVSSDMSGEAHRAAMWRADAPEKLHDLNTLISEESGWVLGRATGVNERGQIVGFGLHYGGISAFLLDPTRPVVFVHGAAASVLVDDTDPANPQEIWLGCGSSRLKLSLDPNEPKRAQKVRVVDAARSLHCGPVSGDTVDALHAYGRFLDRLKVEGYREYEVEGKPARRTTDGCDLIQRDKAPNLFVFAYDWRKSNAIAAAELADFMGCVRKFFPTQEVDIVSHSMGGLVARRYVLTTAEHHVRKHISIGAPWLGAPKLVKVIMTGDFVPFIADGPDVKKIMSGFQAPHQLMSAQYYHQIVGPMFSERGWDYNGDKVNNDAYSWAELKAAIDKQYPATTPATTAEDWHGFPGQVDWRGDASGVDYVHIHGIQDKDQTIGKVTAVRDFYCEFTYVCRYGDHVETSVTRGDGTVPTPSATRQHFGNDLNAEGAEIYGVFANGNDASVEHTALMWHPEVLDKTLDEIRERDEEPTAAARRTAAVDETSSPQRFVRLRGLGRSVVTDSTGKHNGVLAGSDVRGTLPGVSTFAEGDNAELVVLPLGDKPYTVDVKGTGAPGRIEVREGTQERPVEKTRFDDIAVPAGVAARLAISASGLETLRLDKDGDAEFETVVAPTSVQTGATAADVTAPQAVVTAQHDGADRRYGVAATDDESGVRSIRWSTDGARFAPYTGPIDPGTATVLHIAVEDHAGNRTYVGPVSLADVRPTPLTTATVSPQPHASGWHAGAVTVVLQATKATAGSADVAAIHWAGLGATPSAEAKVAGSSVSIPVTASGTSIVNFRAEATDGTLEPWRSVAVRIDGAAPTASLRSPRPGGVVPMLNQIAGVATDDASGVAKVEVSLQRNADGNYWTGAAWVGAATWLTPGGIDTWRITDVPRFADLPEGAYSVRIRATDHAGHVTLTAPAAFRVAPDAGLEVTVLQPPAGFDGNATVTDLNDKGVAAGAAGRGAGIGPVRWDGGRPVALQAPEWAETVRAYGIDDTGRAVGQAMNSATSKAIVWAPDGTASELPSEGQQAMAWGVSAGGIAGEVGQHPVIWDAAGKLVRLPGRDGMTQGAALDIDARGVAVGYLIDDQGRQQATVWENGRARAVGDFGSAGSTAEAINGVGQAVGHGGETTDRSLPFVFDLYDGQQPRVVYVPGEWGKAHDVNDKGDVVGEFELPGSDKVHAFIESEGVFTDLNELLPAGTGWELVRAYSINDVGQVVAFGMKDGIGRAVLISAEHAPIASDVAITTAGKPVGITLAGEDPDPFAVVTHELLTRPAHGTLSAVDGAKVTYTPAAGFTGTDSFTYRAFDGEYRSVAATVTITVEKGANAAPVAVLAAPGSAAEGATVTLDASGSTDADGTVAQWAWDLDGDGQFDDGTGAKVQLTLADNGDRTVSVRVTDDGGATDDATATIRVTGVAPEIVLASTTVSATTGQPWSLSGTFTDAGEDTVTATVDYGTGPGALPLGAGTFSLGTTYATAGVRQVAVQLCDDDGACASATITVTVTDPAPPAPVRATFGGYVQQPGTLQAIALSGNVTSDANGVKGTISVSRGVLPLLALDRVTITSAGLVTEGSQKWIRITGTARMIGLAVAKQVTFEIVLVDGGKTDSAWVEVTDAATGVVVPELSLPRVNGKPAPVTLRGGSVQQR